MILRWRGGGRSENEKTTPCKAEGRTSAVRAFLIEKINYLIISRVEKSCRRMSKKTNKPNEKPQNALMPQEQAVIGQALEARKAAPAPRLKVGKKGIEMDRQELLRLENAIGSSDRRFTEGLLNQLAGAVRRQGKVDELDLNFMLSFIEGMEPRDQIECTLAAQMAAIHIEMMRSSERLGGAKTLPEQDSTLRGINQLARTYATQTEARRRHRTGGEQKVTVEHVTVSEGGQAIVGNVTHAPRQLADRRSSSPTLPHSQKAEIRPIEHSSAPLKRTEDEPL
jgi:hypothetical protein